MAGSEGTTSLWLRDTAPFSPGGADGPASAEVVVIGAGISGLSTAYLLQRAGAEVLLLDERGVGLGESGRTTAHLSNALDDWIHEIERIHGAEGATLAVASHGAAIDWIEATAAAEGIACDFCRVDGYLILADGTPTSKMTEELTAAHRAGLHDVQPLDAPPSGAFAGHSTLLFPRQARFHPMKFLSGLAAAFQRLGGRLAFGRRVVGARGGSDAFVELADGGRIAAKFVVCCSNAPVIDRFAIHSKQAAYRSYAIALEVPKGSVRDALYWDTQEIYHYVRLQPNHDRDLLIVGGEDHKTGEPADMAARFARLEAWARRRFPPIGARISAWSGQVLEPFDGLAFIGRDPANEPNVLLATGDSGMGMTHGAIAGLLLSELIAGREHPWAKLYDPSRAMSTATTLGTWVKENLDVAGRLADHLKPGEVASAEDIAPGAGALVREGLRQVAVYRAPDGQVHRLSPICPHLKCVVHWNEGEASWDCPCHGSRFSATGEKLNGPAASDLQPAED